VHGMHSANSKVGNSAQGSSCKLKFVHGPVKRTLTIIKHTRTLSIPHSVSQSACVIIILIVQSFNDK
jgi:hypothetical protein